MSCRLKSQNSNAEMSESIKPKNSDCLSTVHHRILMSKFILDHRVGQNIEQSAINPLKKRPTCLKRTNSKV